MIRQVARQLIEAVAIVALMAVMGLFASQLPVSSRDPVSPDFHLAQGN